jgi:ElaB/YqjD/DUF883 family membrane-anchored ribosome-binding protein
MCPSSTSKETSLHDDLHKSREKVTAQKDDIGGFTSQAGEAAKTIRGMSETVAAQVGSAASGLVDRSSEFATSATAHAKTFASELEAMARRNPLGTIAGALLVGVVIGMMSRGRS